MFISRIEIRNWRNFNQAEADLRRRVFLLGPNAAGKSNLLDLFRFLGELARDGLRRSVERRGGIGPLRCLAARSVSDITITVILSNDDGPRWRYHLVFNRDAGTKAPVVKEEVVDRLGDPDAVVLNRPDAEDRADPLRRSQTALEQIIANRDFREVAEFFRAIDYLHLVPQVVRDPRGFSALPVHNDPFGRDFLQRVWSTQRRTRDARLRLIGDVLRSAVPQLQRLEIEQDPSDGTPHLIGHYEHWRPKAARQTEAQFSDGTLRLVGLLWALLDGDGPLLLEEPELSLHSEVVRSIPGLMLQLQQKAHQRKWRSARSQVLISTHSRELTSDPGIAPEEVLRLEPSHEGTRLLTPDAEDRALLATGLPVSEVILPRTRPPSLQLLLDADW
ncbi:MAG: AAA family ATPase [Myxococcales bacterium]|nr:AAA family ATPase [Myxococcales bacterium]